ncbi:AAA family ATPase [Mycolicibacterium sp. P9-64]|uniref:helix-turn-helix transcriptional regulator n=1 Tax=Mycolicibacterium sp. P9-64 TaxID=2024612 RepID=UPI0015656466|nr:AAA family ATPase [Mycolicibacterium sp. P9-64]
MPLRGRDQELGDARTVLGRACGADARPGAVVIRGAAGSGKSHLLHAIAQDAAALGFRVLEGGGDADAAAMPLTPLLQAVLGGSPPLLNRRAVQDAMRSAEARYVVIEDIIDALETAARQSPLLVVVDDLQFSDPTTLFALRVMVERLTAEPVVWAMATREPVRDEAVARTLGRLEHLDAVTFTIGELAPDAATEVAQDLLGASVDANLQSLIDRTGGHVVDLVETLRGLLDERRVQIVTGQALLADTATPARLRDAIHRRLSRLPEDVADVVAAAAVMGRRVTDSAVAALTDIPPPQAAAALKAAEDAQLVTSSGDEFVFRHDLIREIVESTLSAALRRDLRRRAVHVQLDAGAPLLEVASALAATAEPDDTQAAELLSQAGHQLAAVDPSTAADLLQRAVDITPPDSERHGALLAQHVMLLWQAGRTVDARRIGERALITGVTPAQEAEVRLGLSLVTSEHSYPDAARQTATALALPDLPPGLRARLLAAHAVTKIMIDDLDDLEATVEEAMNLARSVGDTSTQSSLLATRSTVALHRMQWELAFDLAEQGRRIADALVKSPLARSPKGVWDPSAWSRPWQAVLLSTAGSPDEALRILDQGIAEAEAAREGAAINWMMIRSRVLLEAGRLGDAQAEAEAVSTLTDWRERSTMADYSINFVLRRVAQYTGEQAALKRTEGAVTAMQRDDVGTVRRQGRWLAVIDADADGHPDRAVEMLTESIALYGDVAHPLTLDPADDPLFARIAVRGARRDLAAKAAEFAERRAQANQTFPLLKAIALHTRALVDDDPSALAQAAEAFGDVHRPLPRAAALEDAGRVSADRDTAIYFLDEAHHTYIKAGALRDAARTRQRLRALGARRRQPTQTAVADPMAALTTSERAVVDLVARGATNREVAAQLFLSPHTVSTHLRHAFTKTGVRSRVELTRLATLGEPDPAA